MRVNYTDKMLATLVTKRLEKDSFTTDVTGMNVIIRPSSNQRIVKNAIHFKFKKIYKGKTYNISLGMFPRMQILEARQKYLETLVKFETGALDKAEAPKVKFADLWDEFKAFKFSTIKETTKKKYEYAYSFLKGLNTVNVEDITPDVVLVLLRDLMEQKKFNSLEFVCIILKSFLDYAVFKKVIPYNPLIGITKFLPKEKHKHYSAFKDESLEQDMIELFEAMSTQTKEIQLLVYMYFFTLLRSNELRTLKFSDCHGDYALVKTKTLDEFKVPLCQEAQKIIAYMRSVHTGYNNPYVFEGKAEDGIISCNTVNKMFRAIGFGDRLKVHGIRSCGRQWLQTMPTAKESIIELCLSHVVGGMVQQAYNRGDYYEERKRVLTAWCDFVVKCSKNHLANLLQTEG